MVRCINIYKKNDNQQYCELYIKNTKGLEATTFFDLKDYEFVSSLTWTIKFDYNTIRVRCTSKKYRGKEMSLILM